MIDNLETWHFGIDNDKLVDLVLDGKKTAITSLYEGNTNEKGKKSILIYDNEKKACVTKITKNIIIDFKDITWDMAKLEGEDTNLEEWKNKHIKYFKSINPDFNENTKVVFEIFEVTQNLKEERIELAKKVVDNNLQIFGELKSLEEINAGFNNSLFSINDEYVIKVCGKSSKENLFDVEYNFYVRNNDSKNIPKLYKYDNSKKIISSNYEIIEKIKGKSVYYFWYKWSEEERENFIKELVYAIKQLHLKKIGGFDWCYEIKNKIIDLYNKTKFKFDNEQQIIIESVIEECDDILSDNRFALIHNDLHFDNIMLDENGKIKIIDFNDSRIAPFDYDLKYLFMSKDQPWKWANVEMDPYQKPEDYVNIIYYLKKYYSELNDIYRLDDRMYIYMMLNDFGHLTKFNNQEMVDNIINYSNSILKKGFSKMKAYK